MFFLFWIHYQEDICLTLFSFYWLEMVIQMRWYQKLRYFDNQVGAVI